MAVYNRRHQLLLRVGERPGKVLLYKCSVLPFSFDFGHSDTQDV